MISRRVLLRTFGLAVLAPMTASGQDRARLPRIVLLTWAPLGGDAGETSVIEDGLRALGYTKGVSIAIDYRSAEGREDRLPALAREAVTLNPAVIVAIGTKAAIAAQQATTDVPIVTVAGDIVAAGLVKNLRRPEANITGLSFFTVDLTLKRFELLMELAPKIRRLAVLLVGRPSPTFQEALAALRRVAQNSGVDVYVVSVERVDGVKLAFAKLREAAMTGLLVMPAPLLDARATEIGRLAAEHRLIAMFSWKEYVQAGGLVSYGPDLAALWRRAVAHVDRILRGAKPADLPIEQPTKFKLMMNMTTAKALGLTISSGLLLRADEVLE